MLLSLVACVASPAVYKFLVKAISTQDPLNSVSLRMLIISND